jgi:hypothetical protein
MPCLKVSLESDAPIGMHVTAHVRIVRGVGVFVCCQWLGWRLRRRCPTLHAGFSHMLARLIGDASLTIRRHAYISPQ